MKFTRTRLTWSVLLVTLIAGTALTLIADDEAGSSPLEESMARKRGPEAVAAAKAKEKSEERAEEKKPEGATETPPPISAIREKGAAGCLADQAAFEDMRKRREELDAHAKDLAARDLELKARERALDEQLKKLEQVREEIAKTEGGYKKENQEKVAKLVETFEGMSPKATASLLSNIDDGLAVAAMTQMSTVKLSKVMNVMDAEHASKLTELLAGVTRAKSIARHKAAKVSTSPITDVAEVAASQPPQSAVPVQQSAKGGETENGHKNEQQQPVSSPQENSSQREPAAQKGKGSS